MQTRTDTHLRELLIRVKRLAALREPARTAESLEFVRRLSRDDLIPLCNALAFDCCHRNGPVGPSLPRHSTPAWAQALPIEFFAAISRRIWPKLFRNLRTPSCGALMPTLPDEIAVLRRRAIARQDLWHPADVKQRLDARPGGSESKGNGVTRGGRRGPRGEDDGSDYVRPKTRGTQQFPTVHVLPGMRERTDAELVHEFVCNFVSAPNSSAIEMPAVCAGCKVAGSEESMFRCVTCGQRYCATCATVGEVKMATCKGCQG